MANGYDTWYDKAYPERNPRSSNLEWEECDECGEDICIDLEDGTGETLFYKIPGQKECFCKKCFPKVLASVAFHKECAVTANNYDTRRRI